MGKLSLWSGIGLIVPCRGKRSGDLCKTSCGTEYLPCLVTNWTCREPRLPCSHRAGVGGIPLGPKTLPDVAMASCLVLQPPKLEILANLLQRPCTSDCKTNLTRLVFSKVSHPASARLVFIYYQIPTLWQILLQMILQGSGSKPRPK